MASACALAIISGIGFLFGIQKSLRAFLNPLFTGGSVKVNGSCRAGFLRKHPRGGERTLSVIAARCHLPRKGEVLLYLPVDAEKLPLSGELAKPIGFD